MKLKIEIKIKHIFLKLNSPNLSILFIHFHTSFYENVFILFSILNKEKDRLLKKEKDLEKSHVIMEFFFFLDHNTHTHTRRGGGLILNSGMTASRLKYLPPEPRTRPYIRWCLRL